MPAWVPPAWQFVKPTGLDHAAGIQRHDPGDPGSRRQAKQGQGRRAHRSLRSDSGCCGTLRSLRVS